MKNYTKRKNHGKAWSEREKQIVTAFTKNFAATKLVASKKQNDIILCSDDTIIELARGLERGHGATIIRVAICSYNLGYPIRVWGKFKF